MTSKSTTCKANKVEQPTSCSEWNWAKNKQAKWFNQINAKTSEQSWATQQIFSPDHHKIVWVSWTKLRGMAPACKTEWMKVRELWQTNQMELSDWFNIFSPLVKTLNCPVFLAAYPPFATHLFNARRTGANIVAPHEHTGKVRSIALQMNHRRETVTRGYNRISIIIMCIVSSLPKMISWNETVAEFGHTLVVLDPPN